MIEFDSSSIKTYKGLKELIQSSNISYDLVRIRKAYELAKKLHDKQLRRSNETVLTHLMSVAGYIVRLGLDTTSVVAALLHEIKETEKITIDEIDEQFGTDVAFLIDGMSNLRDQTAVFSKHNEDPHNFRKLILASTEDIRILIIRLANKYHNLKTLNVLPVSRQINQANKIKYVYAPLCEYLGLGHFQASFENKAFEILNNDEYELIRNYTKSLYAKSADSMTHLENEINLLLTKCNILNSTITTRKKNYSSTYNKILKKHAKEGERISNEHVEKIKDLIGLRVIVNTVDECYLLLGLIHEKWEYDSAEFDDYIMKPKISGYRSIHTVINYNGSSIEIQIRTHEMHEFNEFGPASHIAYKLQSFKKNEIHTWTKDLLAWKQKDNVDKDIYKLKAFNESVFVFTPKGKVIMLEKGATPIDFAYRVHTDIGKRYTGAIVNKKMVSMEYELKTGDVVEIITANKPNVNADWLKFAKTADARRRIKNFVLKKKL